MSDRVRVGVVGCGLIAQVMHLPYLRELADRFEIAAVCDLSVERVRAVADLYGVPAATTDWRELVDQPLDAVMVLTSGDHAPIASAAIRAGRHAFVEKPLALSVGDGQRLVAEADAAGVTLMVGYMKRYDPAYERLRQELPAMGRLRHARLTTLESPGDPYVGHYPLVPASPLPPEVLARLRAEDADRVREALGDVGPELARVYREWLLDSMIHELDGVRGLLGEPDRLEFASVTPDGITAVLRFGSLECVASWVDLPGITRYRQEWTFVSADRRALLEFPSPYLRSLPTLLVFEDGTAGSVASSRTEHVESYDEAFRRELVEFHEAVALGRPPRTDGPDGVRDIALCAAIVRSALEGRPVDRPSEPAPIALAS
ncbi:MAG TPA: Gfo/Idh/MocA family oxidoreductase [Candidatus Dormibacteraeota bacterium]|nr:Gfo/Idh/MocA family oxidoreductase [Candidatus Dormibacteraeota bacterium]